MKMAILVAAHDGIVSMVTGVGVVVSSFIESFEEIKNNSFLKNHDVEFFCLSPFLKRDSTDFNNKVFKISKDSCKKNNGKLINVPTFSDGESQNSIWGDINQWKSASLSVASYLNSIKNKYDKIIIFAHDYKFAAIRNYRPNINNLKVIWIPHSLGKTFEDEYTDNNRIDYENLSISNLVKNNDFIGYIGNSFKNNLMNNYNVPEKNLLTLENGIYPNSFRYIKNDYLKKKLFNKYNIPKDKKLIFSWGRCVFQKGYDVLIPGSKKFLEKNSDYHLVLLMPSETSQEAYLEDINDKLSQLPEESYTAIFKFDDLLPFSVLTSDNLDIVIFPSRFEGEAITALETDSFSNDNVKIIYSDIPSFRDRYDNNSLAIRLKELTSGEIANCLDKANSMKLKNGDDKLSMKRDIVKNYLVGIELLGGKI